MNPSKQSNYLDLSSFPLLRIDQVNNHSDETLLKSEEALTELLLNSSMENNDDSSENNDDPSIMVYTRKLLDRIRGEMAHRRVRFLLNNDHTNEGNANEHHQNDDLGNSTPCNDSIDTSTPSSPQHKLCIPSTKSLIASPSLSSPSESDTTSHTSRSIQKQRKNNSLNINGNTKKIPTQQQKSQPTMKIQSSSKNAFVVIPSNSSKHRKNCFRTRSKIATAAMKAKEQTSSAEYQEKQMEDEKMKRRQRAIKRVALHKARKKQRLRILAKRKWQRELREEERRHKHEEVIREMEQHARDAKDKLVQNGDVVLELEGNEAAATAAALVLENAAIDFQESDSASSIGSHIDEFSECSTSCNETTITAQNDLEANKLGLQQEENIVEKLNVNYDQSYLMVDPEQSESSDVEAESERCSKSSIDDSSIDNKYQIDISLTNVEKQNVPETSHDAEINNICGTVPNLAGGVENVKKLLQDVIFPIENEVEWCPWLSKTDTKLQSQQKDLVHLNKYAFSDIYPHFHAIFTSFYDQSKGALRTDLEKYRERSCLEYQIKIHRALEDLTNASNTTECDEKDDDFNGKRVGTLSFRVSSWKQEVNSIISDVLSCMNFNGEKWIETKDDERVGNCWNLLWTWKKPKFNQDHLLACQKISRFQNTSALTSKDRLKKKLQQYCNVKNRQEIMPQTFLLPGEYSAFVSTFYESSQNTKVNNFWILKPIGMSRGRGISLISDIGEVSYSLPSVIQRYIPNPLLFHGFKFDLRLFVTVLSFSPKLEAFIFSEGFARFGSQRFTDQIEHIGDIRIHLTNSSIQKDYLEELSTGHPVRLAGSDGGGNKVIVSWLWKRLDEMGISSSKIWTRIKDLCSKTLVAVRDDISSQQNSFEVFGFDILIDSSQQPWLIEVNACPSLARDTDIDHHVKDALIEDTIKLVQPCIIDRSALGRICMRRLYQTTSSRTKSISCKDQLEKDLREIFCARLPRQYGDPSENGTRYQRLG